MQTAIQESIPVIFFLSFLFCFTNCRETHIKLLCHLKFNTIRVAKMEFFYSPQKFQKLGDKLQIKENILEGRGE